MRRFSFAPLTTRNARQLRLASMRWQRLALFVLGGVVVGAAAVGLALTADWASKAFQAALRRSPLAALALTPLGFALSSWTARRFFPNSGGSGIPQAIAARQLQGRAARERLVSLRIAVGKAILLLLGAGLSTFWFRRPL